MKKYVLAFAVFIAFAMNARAQKISGGIKGGFNITDVAGINGDNRLSAHVGVFINSRITSQWSIQPELLYSGQGQQYRIGNEEFTLALSYLQIPIMFQFHPTKQFYIDFGPQIGILLSANTKNDDDKWEADEYYKKADIGLAIGAGFNITRQVGIYGRYIVGLADISKNNLPDYSNRVGQIGLSIKFK
ncbi:MAG TPA: porin family protein [Niastella sp.]|nr:porin family protein [Niastella sp.]